MFRLGALKKQASLSECPDARNILTLFIERGERKSERASEKERKGSFLTLYELNPEAIYNRKVGEKETKRKTRPRTKDEHKS